MAPKNRFCVISNCKYFKGTKNDENIHMFGIPIAPESLRIKWIKAIEQANDSKYNGLGRICHLHFYETDYEVKNGRFKLAQNSVPKLFEGSTQDSFIESTDCTTPIGCQALKSCVNCQKLEASNERLDMCLRNLQIISGREKETFDKKLKSALDENIEKSAQISEMKMKIAILEKRISCLEKENRIKRIRPENQLRTYLINGNKKLKKYPPFIRRFCLGLHYKSAGAYDFVRKSLNNSLPHPGTLRQWYLNSNIVNDSGINQSVLEELRKLAAEMKSKGEDLVVCLSSDEMNIRKHFQWCNQTKRLLGYSTLRNDCQEVCEVAKQALVYMVNCVNLKKNIPLAHYFITSLGSQKRMEIHMSIMNALLEIGITLSSIVFDGLSSNTKMCNLLGANLNVNASDFRSYFGLNGHEINIFYDNCHMLKLIRNTLGRKRVFYDMSGAQIKWEFIEKLVDFKKTHDLKMTHKLNQTHLNWKKNIMKVDIATQTLSASTANSMEYLMHNGFQEFSEAGATIKFIKIFNDLFDIFNTKSSKSANEFKNELCSDNKEDIFNFFEYAVEYIRGLKMENDQRRQISIVSSKNRTGFVGFIVNMASLKNIYSRFVERDETMTKIKTFCFQQDPLELFFGKIRSMNGFNDNPTMQQFAAAFRKLLACDSITGSRKSNCQAVDSGIGSISNICDVSSRKFIGKGANMDYYKDDPKTKETISKNLTNLYEKMAEMNEIDFGVLSEGLGSLTIAHIACIIERKLKSTKLLKCRECCNAFKDEKYVGGVFPTDEAPCRSTYKICDVVGKFMKLSLLRDTENFEMIRLAIFNEINIDELFSKVDVSHDPDHKLLLIRFVIDTCINIKGTQIAREATLDEHKKSYRNKFRKLLHFYGQ